LKEEFEVKLAQQREDFKLQREDVQKQFARLDELFKHYL
jgi:hypothetical protein